LLFGITGVDFAEAEELAREEHARFVETDEVTPDIAAWLLRADVDGVAPVDRPYTWGISDVAVGALGIRLGQIKRADEVRIGNALRNDLRASKKRDWKGKGGTVYAVSEEAAKAWARGV
jgi:hypothetical protein